MWTLSVLATLGPRRALIRRIPGGKSNEAYGLGDRELTVSTFVVGLVPSVTSRLARFENLSPDKLARLIRSLT